jgi:hypothetical protein
MNFGQFQSGLEASTLELLTEAFDKAWAELEAGNGKGIADEQVTRDRLGRKIIAAAITEGAKNPQKLTMMALEGFEL